MKSVIFLMLASASIPAMAGVKCADVKYGNERYHESMERLATEAHLEDSYYTRYHEDVVGYLCAGKSKEIQSLIDQGAVKYAEVEAIKKVLGKQEVLVKAERSERGRRYGDSKQKFLEMGLCSACADNVALYYADKPDSRCGKLAKRALDGAPDAIKELQGFPPYCGWK